MLEGPKHAQRSQKDQEVRRSWLSKALATFEINCHRCETERRRERSAVDVGCAVLYASVPVFTLAQHGTAAPEKRRHYGRLRIDMETTVLLQPM